MALPLLIPAIIGGFVSAAGTLIGQAMISIGVGFITYTGFKAFLDEIQALAIDQFDGLPIMILQGAGMMKLDVAISMLFSAYAARLLLQGLTGDKMKRFAIK